MKAGKRDRRKDGKEGGINRRKDRLTVENQKDGSLFPWRIMAGAYSNTCLISKKPMNAWSFIHKILILCLYTMSATELAWGGKQDTHRLWSLGVSSLEGEMHQESTLEVPWWLSGKESNGQWRRHGFHPWPWSGKTPHASEQLSLCTTAESML